MRASLFPYPLSGQLACAIQNVTEAKCNYSTIGRLIPLYTAEDACWYMYLCVYGHTFSKSMDPPGMVANPARGQLFFSFFSFISLIADGPHHYHPACGHKGASHLSPVHALQFFIAMQVQHSYNSSTNG